MNRHALRVLVVVLFCPFIFGSGARFGPTAGASVMPTYMIQGTNSSSTPTSQLPTLAPQPVKMPGGFTGWRVRLPDARPLGTPAVGNGEVLIGGGFGSYEMYAFDAATGKLSWALKTTDDGPTSAVVDRDMGVYNTESCTVEAVNINTGQRVWARTLGDPLMSQPAVADGRVYMASPSSDSAGHRLYCLKLTSGDTLWTQTLPADAISAPVVHDGAVYCSTIDGTVSKIDAANGKVAWRHTSNATSAPWIDENDVVTFSQRVAGRPAKPNSVGGKPTHAEPTEEAFASSSNDGLKEQNSLAPVPAPYLDSGRNSNVSSTVTEQSASASVGFATAPATAGINYADTNLGVTSVDAVWAYQGSRPIVHHGRNYNVQDNVARCMDASTGRTIWKQSFRQDRAHVRTLTPLSEAGGKLYFGSASGTVGCLSKSDGKLLWSCRLDSGVVFPPSIVKGRVYVTTEDGYLYCLDTRDGTSDAWPMWGGSASHDGPHS